MTQPPELRDLPQGDDEAADLGVVVRAHIREGGIAIGVEGHVRSHGVPRKDVRTSKASESGAKTFEPALAAVTRGSLNVNACMNALRNILCMHTNVHAYPHVCM